MKLKILFYNKFATLGKKINIKGFTEYEKNKELMLYILTRRIVDGIIKHINNIIEIEFPIESNQELIHEILYEDKNNSINNNENISESKVKLNEMIHFHNQRYLKIIF